MERTKRSGSPPGVLRICFITRLKNLRHIRIPMGAQGDRVRFLYSVHTQNSNCIGKLFYVHLLHVLFNIKDTLLAKRVQEKPLLMLKQALPTSISKIRSNRSRSGALEAQLINDPISDVRLSFTVGN